MKTLSRDLDVVRLAAERAVLRRFNAGYGFANRRSLVETFLHDQATRERVGRDLLRPEDTHAEQLAEVEKALGAAREQPSATDRFAAHLGVGPTGGAIFACAVAFALDADVRAMCTALGSSGRELLSVAVCAELFPDECGDAVAAIRALHSRSPLCAHRALVVSETAGIGATISVGPDTLAALTGDARVPARLAGFVSAVSAGGDNLLGRAVSGRIADVAALIRGGAEAPIVITTGAQGSGKRVIAAELGSQLGRPVVSINVAGSPDLADALAFARLHGQIAYVAGLEAAEQADTLASLVDGHDDVVILTSRDKTGLSVSLSRPTLIVAAPRPTLEVRAAAWKQGLAELKPDEDADALAARYVIGAGAIAEVIEDARRHATATGEALSTARLEDSIGRRLSLNLGVLGQRISRRASFDEMVLPEDVIDTLRDLVAMVNGRSQILESWGYERHLGLSRGVSALFSGAPGTGKTMAASVISSELGLELFRIDLSSVVSKWVGETEKNLARIFDEAQDAHAMLLFDEADSLFGKRTDVQSATDRYANLEVNYVLQRMEQFDGISILTTNLESGIDAAFMRRLNFRVRFPDPEAEERELLWRKLLPPETELDLSDVSDLANRFEMTGGHIRNAIVRAAVVASREGRQMVLEDLVRGAHSEYYELGKVMHSSL